MHMALDAHELIQIDRKLSSPTSYDLPRCWGVARPGAAAGSRLGGADNISYPIVFEKELCEMLMHC